MKGRRACSGKISELTAQGTGPRPGEKAARYSSRHAMTSGLKREGQPALYR